jgi:hypothetical protein
VALGLVVVVFTALALCEEIAYLTSFFPAMIALVMGRWSATEGAGRADLRGRRSLRRPLDLVRKPGLRSVISRSRA